MKNQLLFLLGFCLIGIHLHSQTQDPQWLISNNKGKSRYNSSGNVFGTAIPGPFALKGVSAPNRANPNAKNDVLVIYQDGRNFHTRFMTTTNSFFRSTPSSGGTDHTFKSTHTSPVAYMYLSNRYERDDLPEDVKVNNESDGLNIMDITNTPILSANNSVVPNKDITLILNMDSLEQKTTYTLTYNAIAPYSSPTSAIEFTANVLSPMAVFGSGPSLLPELSSHGGESNFGTPGAVLLTNTGGIKYINFRPTDAANAYMPDEKGTRYYVVFTLTNNAGFVETIREPMLYSQDPNFLRVDSIQRLDDGHMIFYHLEFENVGEIPTNELSVKVKFPSFFDLDHLEAGKWFAGNAHCGHHPCKGDVHINGDSVTFEFQQENQLQMCFGEDSISCKGFVDFKVKVKEGNDVMNPNFSLRLDTPRVFFHPSSFPLHEFRDLIRDVDGKHMRLVMDGKSKDNTPRPNTFWERWRCEILIGFGVIVLLLLIILLIRWQRNNP